VVPSNQHLYRKTVSLVLVVTAIKPRATECSGFRGRGVEIKNIHNFDENWITRVPLWYKKIKSGRKKTATINTKNRRSFITVKARCSMTNLKQQKSLIWFLLVLRWAMDVIYDFYYMILHPWPSGQGRRQKFLLEGPSHGERGARAYNRFWGQSPWRGPGADRPLVGGHGARPP